MNDPRPDLTFYAEEPPPRRTLQSGRGARVCGGKVRFFTRKAERLEAERMRDFFKAALPPGWKPRPGPCKVRVELVYPLRRKDRVAGDELLPHAERPDADNLLKSLLDAMTRAGVWEDDGQVFNLGVCKYRCRRPCWRVCVWFAHPPARPVQGLFDFGGMTA